MAYLRIRSKDSIYVWADVTDEDAFRLATDGLTFRGREKGGHYHIHNFVPSGVPTLRTRYMFQKT
jgi:hypothetical protein